MKPETRTLIKSYIFGNTLAHIFLVFVLSSCMFFCVLGISNSYEVFVSQTYDKTNKFVFWFGLVTIIPAFFIILRLFMVVRFYCLPKTIQRTTVSGKGTEIVHGTKYDHTGYFIYFENDKIELSDKKWERLNEGDVIEIEYKVESSKKYSLLRIYRIGSSAECFTQYRQ